MRLLISDTNVLIDIEDGKLVAPLFRLPHRIATPDVLCCDELEFRHPDLPDSGLELLGLSEPLIDEA